MKSTYLFVVPGVLALAVQTCNAAVNDNFANRLVLSGNNATSGGTNQTATDELNEPEHSALPAAQRHDGAHRAQHLEI